MNKKVWYYILSSVSAAVSSIPLFINKEYAFAIVMIAFASTLIIMSFLEYRKDNIKKTILTKSELKNIRLEIEPLIIDGREIDAIKMYRKLTGYGLKEASDYVSSLKVTLRLNI